MRVLVMANDAGGAEMLAALVAAERESHEWCLTCRTDAPAHRIFAQQGFDQEVVLYEGAWPELPGPYDAALCNVGWRDVKDGMVAWLRRCVPRTIGVLDNWVNYRERFGYPDPSWIDRLPDWMVACDQAAWKRAAACGFPRVARLHHYLLAGQRARWIRMGSPTPGSDLLWLSQIVQPRGAGALAGTPYQRYEEPERLMLADVMKHWPAVAAHFGCSRLVIRRHPSAPTGLYEDLASASSVPVRVEAQTTDLLTSLAMSRAVLGFTSAALMTAWVVGRPAYSLVPEGAAGPLPLPPAQCTPTLAHLMAPSHLESRGDTLDLFPQYPLAGLWPQLGWS